MSATGRTLVVNADDLGLSPAVDRGILAAHREGIVTSTSLLVTLPGFPAAVERLRACPALGVGIHLSLTCGQRVSPAHARSKLTGADGRLPSLRRLIARLALRRLDVEELTLELCAQVDRARAAGIQITHLDTHHNVHLHPLVWRAVERVAAEQRIAWVRFRGQAPLLWAAPRGAGLQGLLQRARQRAGAALVARAARGADPGVPRWIAGAPAPAGGVATGLEELLRALPVGVTELVCHPGEVDAELFRWDPGSGDRLAELEALRRPELRAELAASGVRCTHYGALGPAAELGA